MFHLRERSGAYRHKQEVDYLPMVTFLFCHKVNLQQPLQTIELAKKSLAMKLSYCSQ